MTSKYFACPQCQQNQLTIELTSDIEPDEYNDEAKLQTIVCENCNYKGIAIYQESHRGALDNYNFSHIGYTTPEELYNKIKNDIQNNQIKNIDNYLASTLSSFKMEMMEK